MNASILRFNASIRQARNRSHGYVRLAWSANGRWLALADADRKCAIQLDGTEDHFLDLRSRDPKAKALQRVRTLRFIHSDTSVLACAGDQLVVADLAAQSVKWRYVHPRSFAFLVVAPEVAVELQDGSIFVAYTNCTCLVFSDDGRIEARWRSNEAPRVAAVNRDGHIVGSDSFHLSVFEPRTGKRLANRSLTDRAFCLAVSNDGELVAIRGLRQIALFDASTLEKIAEIPAAMGLPEIAFHPTLPQLAMLESNSISLWNYKGQFLDRYVVPEAVTLCLAFHPSGTSLHVGCSDRTLREFSLPTGNS